MPPSIVQPLPLHTSPNDYVQIIFDIRFLLERKTAKVVNNSFTVKQDFYNNFDILVALKTG